MTRHLPPLNALRAFEAAARHGSFQAAAAELNVTAAAISQRVKLLETALGTQLFRRLHRGVALSDAGGRYAERIGAALDMVAAATGEIDRRDQGARVRVTVLPVLAEMWLLPRLSRFHRRHPEIELLLSTDAPVVDFRSEGFDVGLRYTDGQHPGVTVRRLFEETIFPVCAPELAQRLCTPGDLAHTTLLYDQHWQDDWRLWLEAAGRPELLRGRGGAFGLYSLAAAAARNGLGVLIGHSRLIADDLARGNLVAPFDLRVPAPHAHHVAWPPWAQDRPAVKAFVSWVLKEAGV